MNDNPCVLPGYEPRQGPVSQPGLYRTCTPGAPLNRWIQSFWQLAVPRGCYRYRSIPDNCVDWIVALEDSPRNFIIPPFPSARVFPLTGPVTYFGVRFRVLAHTGLFPAPAGRLDGDPAAEDIAAGPHLSRIYDDLLGNETFPQRCRALARALPEALDDPATDRRVVRFVRDAHGRCGQTPARLSDSHCARFGLSARQLRRLCQLHLGIGPKQFTRVLRFQSSLAAAGSRPEAPPAGFCDQAHFIRDFKSLSGVTPGAFANMSVLSNNYTAQHAMLGFPDSKRRQEPTDDRNTGRVSGHGDPAPR